MTDGRKGLILGFLGMLIFSLSLPATRVAVADLPADFVTAIRACGAGILASTYLLYSRSRPPNPSELRHLAGVVAGVVIGFPLFSAFAMQTVDASHGGVVLALLPLFTALAAMLVAGEEPSPRFFLYALLGSATVLVFVLSRSKGGFAVGDLHLVAAAALASIGYAAGGALSRKRPGLEVISWALALSLPLSAIALWLTWPDALGDISARAWVGTAYATIFAQFLGFYFFYRGMALGGVAKVGQIQLLQVYLTIAASAVLLNETIDAILLAAAALTMVFVWLGRRAQVG